jgi:hypothetical protein
MTYEQMQKELWKGSDELVKSLLYLLFAVSMIVTLAIILFG